MKTPAHLFHHDIPQIRRALQIAQELANDHGDPLERQHIDYALKRLNDWAIPSGVTVDGREVPVQAVYTGAMLDEMRARGTN